ncbi:MAG: hypothetical protein WDA12_04505 [Bacilli bacterium]
MVSISYFPTNVQRLYQIGETGMWQTYIDYNNSLLNNGYIMVDNSLIGNRISVKWYQYSVDSLKIAFLDQNKTIISTHYQGNIFVVPVNTKWIKFISVRAADQLYEISFSN